MGVIFVPGIAGYELYSKTVQGHVQTDSDAMCQQLKARKIEQNTAVCRDT